MALGFVGFTRSLSRKRVVLSSNVEAGDDVSPAPLKRLCSEKSIIVLDTEKSRFEALPEEILIKVLCGVEHEDLKQLLQVSKCVRDAALIAKQTHFAYRTPTKQKPCFGAQIKPEDSDGSSDIEAPNAPMRKYKSRVSGKKLAVLSVALFASTDEEKWPRK